MRSDRRGAASIALPLVVLAVLAAACGTGATRSSSAAPPARDAASVTAPVVSATPPAARCRGVRVTPRRPLQAAIDSHPAGTIFCLAPGTYRLAAPLVPRSGDVFDGGGRRAILDGSRRIASSSFRRTGRLWVASGRFPQHRYAGRCESGTPLCEEADDVFRDGRPLAPAGAPAKVGRGTFYLDHAGGRIYLGDDPAGHRVEATVTASAFHGWGTGVERVALRGLVVQHFAIHGVECRASWTVTSSELRWNHGDGIQDCGTVLYSSLHDNGKSGYVFAGRIGVTNGPYVFSHNTVSRNNWAGFDPGWEAGGAKFLQAAHLTVSHNLVVDNGGNGLWTDWGNRFVAYDANVVERNRGSGILHEASYDATISGNVLVGNGDGCSGTLCGAAIMLNDSQSVDIGGNTLVDNRNGIGIAAIARGSTELGPLTAQNVSVHDNTVARSGASGLVQWNEDGSFYTSRGIRFSRNRYVVCGDEAPFVWQNPSNPSSYTSLTWPQWQQAGNDTTGSYGCGDVEIPRGDAGVAG